MRISDWSSDVCSSDLARREWFPGGLGGRARSGRKSRPQARTRHELVGNLGHPSPVAFRRAARTQLLQHTLPRPDRHADWPAVAGADQPDLPRLRDAQPRSEEHTSELQSLMRISYAVFCLKKKTNKKI